MMKKQMTNNKTKFKLPGGLLKNNKFIFVISLFLAIIIWLTVSPNRVVTVGMNLSLDTANSSAESLGLEVIGDNSNHIDVSVSGKWYVISELKDKDINLKYSLADVTKAGEYEISISAEKSAGNADFDIVKVTPDKIKVSFDFIITRSFKIEATAPNVKAADGFILEAPVLNNDESIIDITGPMSVVDSIKSVSVNVNAQETLEKAKSYLGIKLDVVDKNGKKVDTSSLTMPFTSADVTVPISKSKKIPLKVEFSNAPDYYKKNPFDYSLSVSKINVIGVPEVIDALDNIVIGTIDFTNITPDTKSIDFDLTLPSGVRTIDDIKKVSCKLNVSSLSSKVIDVTSFKTINEPSGSNISVVTVTKAVKVVGPSSVISNLSAKDVYIECDLNNKKGEFVEQNVTLKSNKYNNIWGTGDYKNIQIKVS